jgi:hypothetical protein
MRLVSNECTMDPFYSNQFEGAYHYAVLYFKDIYVHVHSTQPSASSHLIGKDVHYYFYVLCYADIMSFFFLSFCVIICAHYQQPLQWYIFVATFFWLACCCGFWDFSSPHFNSLLTIK